MSAADIQKKLELKRWLSRVERLLVQRFVADGVHGDAAKYVAGQVVNKSRSTLCGFKRAGVSPEEAAQAVYAQRLL